MRIIARTYQPNWQDDDARMRPGSKGRPGGNIVDQGYVVNGVLKWQRMAGNINNASQRATGPLIDPNTKDKPYIPGHER